MCGLEGAISPMAGIAQQILLCSLAKGMAWLRGCSGLGRGRGAKFYLPVSYFLMQLKFSLR